MLGFVTFIGILGLLPFGVQWVAVGCLRDNGLDELVGNVKVDGKALGQRLDGPPCKKSPLQLRWGCGSTIASSVISVVGLV